MKIFEISMLVKAVLLLDETSQFSYLYLLICTLLASATNNPLQKKNVCRYPPALAEIHLFYSKMLYRVFHLWLYENKRLLGHQKCTFKS